MWVQDNDMCMSTHELISGMDTVYRGYVFIYSAKLNWKGMSY